MTKKLLMLTCASSALTLWAGASQAATAATDTTTQGASSVTELVVTAERREQSLQKVPVAVSVFTGAQRDTIGINTVADVTNFAPGFTYDPGTVHAFIRGLGLPRSLQDVRIGPKHFDRIAEQAMGTPWVPRNPRKIETPAQVREILVLAA